MDDSATTDRPPVFDPAHLGELTAIVPPEMVDAALEAGHGLQHRCRRLPSRVIVYLLLAGVLFAEQGWLQVWSRLTSALTSGVSDPSRSSISQAMRRVGVAPLRELFTLLAGPGPTHTIRFAGRLVVAIDGTQIAVADTDANRACYPKHSSGPNGGAGYPMIRLIAIIATGTRTVVDAVFGSDRVSELRYADVLASRLHRGMLVLGDRNFSAGAFCLAVHAAGADFLIRGKTNATARVYPIEQVLADGSFLSRIDDMAVRIIDADLAISTSAGARSSRYRLVTTLLDPRQAPASDLVELYHRRWEIETAYCELKSSLLGGRVLRGRYPAAIEQQVWAILTCYQALRTAMADAILDRPDIDADRLSFSIAHATARDQLVHATARHTDSVVDLVGVIGAAVLARVMPAKCTRTGPRAIKRAISKHRAQQRDTERRTRPATLHITLLTATADP